MYIVQKIKIHWQRGIECEIITFPDNSECLINKPAFKSPNRPARCEELGPETNKKNLWPPQSSSQEHKHGKQIFTVGYNAQIERDALGQTEKDTNLMDKDIS